MASGSFFDETEEQSIVKATIVSKYFWSWAKVIIPSAKKMGESIAYIDLFAGPGRYLDGAKSTPLLVLEKVIADPDMREMLISIFNDKDPGHSRSLRAAINGLPGITLLKHPPRIHTAEVSEDIVRIFEESRLVPTFFFVDPWGYKGLSLRLINAVLKNWGCDCVFFFNYNRINMGLSNPAVQVHMDALFGPERGAHLRSRLNNLDPDEREMTVVEELSQALKEMGRRYVLPFRFRNAAGSRTSHHLIFVTKHFRGYEIMKDIMARESSDRHQGIPSLEYNPATERQPLLFQLTRPLDQLGDLLREHFAGRTLTMREIYEEHSVDRPYNARNYKDALLSLEAAGVIQVPPLTIGRKRPAGTFGDRVVVKFPPRP